MKLFTRFKNIDNRNNKKEILKKLKIQKPAWLLFSLSFVFTNDSNDRDVVGSVLSSEVVVGSLGGGAVGISLECEVGGVGFGGEVVCSGLWGKVVGGGLGGDVVGSGLGSEVVSGGLGGEIVDSGLGGEIIGSVSEGEIGGSGLGGEAIGGSRLGVEVVGSGFEINVSGGFWWKLLWHFWL